MSHSLEKTKSILALPRSTASLLGSAQTLTDPASLVKELIDNSIDAKATAINVLISSDSLSKIEVRDNGHGISMCDLDALGRPGHTSKLKSFQELRYLGGKTLGFRGQALASVSMLGEVTITTRTDGEPVATTVKLNPSGGIASQIRASHPVGTTVSVTKFLTSLPVRKQNSLQAAPKTLSKIKDLIQAYVLARPHTKFSLKTVNCGQSTWSFAPRPDSTIKDAVLQVIGKAATLQCIEKSFSFPSQPAVRGVPFDDAKDAQPLTVNMTTESESQNRDKNFHIRAFLPGKNADLAKVRCGQYISVDSRPMSCNRGISKKIVALFKNYARLSFPKYSSQKFGDVFLLLNIDCPAASYDPNVEPAKDDVLFEDEPLILQAVELLFEEVYGICNSSSQSLAQGAMGIGTDKSEPVLYPIPGRFADGGVPHPQENKKWNFNMSKDYTEENESDAVRIHDGTSTIRGQQDHLNRTDDSYATVALNPWVIARMTRSVPEKHNTQKSIGLKEVAANGSVSISNMKGIALSNHNPEFQNDPNAGAIELPTPTSEGQFTENNTNKHLRGAISEQSTPARTGKNLSQFDSLLLPSPSGEHDFMNGRSFAHQGILSPPWTQIKKMDGPVTCNKSSFLTSNLNIRPLSPEPTQLWLPTSNQILSIGEHKDNTLRPTESNSDLTWAMAFEDRKESATRCRREQLRSAREIIGGVDSVSSSRASSMEKSASPIPLRPVDHANGYSSLKTPAHENLHNVTMMSQDPRAYWIRSRYLGVEKSPISKGLGGKQINVSLLPLEKIPTRDRLHNLHKKIRANARTIHRAMVNLAADDSYLQGQAQITGLTLVELDAETLATRLRILGNTWAESKMGKGDEIQWIFSGVRE